MVGYIIYVQSNNTMKIQNIKVVRKFKRFDKERIRNMYCQNFYE